jgi:hypothetical protein
LLPLAKSTPSGVLCKREHGQGAAWNVDEVPL